MQKLREIRERQGLSQDELAEKSGVSRVTISMLETGSQENAKTKTLFKLAAALNVSIDSFF